MADMETSRPRALERWAGLGGIAYVVLFVLGTLLMYSGQPDTDEAPAKLIAYYGDSGHRDKIFVGWILVVLSIFFLIWFVAVLRDWLQRYAGNSVLPTVALVGGAAYAACTLVAASVQTAIKTMSDDTYRDEVYPPLIHAADDAGYVIHSAGGAAIRAMMIAASIVVLRVRVVPTWLGWLGILAGISAIVSIFFFPWFAIALWLIVASIALVRSTAPSAYGTQSAPR